MYAGKYQWPYRDNSSENNYRMEFKIKKMEAIKRRDRFNAPCYGLEDYDDFVISGIMKRVGCRVPFTALNEELPICSTQEDMKNISDRVIEYYYGSVQDILPCNEIQQIQFDFVEVDYSRIFDFGNNYDFSFGWFMIRLEFQSLTYKEITCVQKYCIESLVGNAGGYVGLFVGYTLRELPFIIVSIYNFFTKW